MAWLHRIRRQRGQVRPKDQRVLPTLRELLASRYEKESGS